MKPQMRRKCYFHLTPGIRYESCLSLSACVCVRARMCVLRQSVIAFRRTILTFCLCLHCNPALFLFFFLSLSQKKTKKHSFHAIVNISLQFNNIFSSTHQNPNTITTTSLTRIKMYWFLVYVGCMQTDSVTSQLDSNVQEINWHVAAAVKPQSLHCRNT